MALTGHTTCGAHSIQGASRLAPSQKLGFKLAHPQPLHKPFETLFTVSRLWFEHAACCFRLLATGFQRASEETVGVPSFTKVLGEVKQQDLQSKEFGNAGNGALVSHIPCVTIAWDAFSHLCLSRTLQCPRRNAMQSCRSAPPKISEFLSDTHMYSSQP